MKFIREQRIGTVTWIISDNFCLVNFALRSTSFFAILLNINKLGRKIAILHIKNENFSKIPFDSIFGKFL